MSRIQQLDAQIANMIAAGEVVERPMGVVKELVENAIDAGSTRIVVSITDGGIEKVQVEDNGCGMDHIDARMAFLRHATSKIRVQNDLWNIHTLGFRGEALPSIASVSKLTMNTSDGNDATHLVMEYGKETAYEAMACPAGTSITVEGLFYHTPARLKHLRSASYEASLIQNLLVSFALSHPEIAFRLFSQDKEVFRTSGNGNLLEVLFQAAGRPAAENAVKIDLNDFDYHVTGYIVKPVMTRASRTMEHVFMNHRIVRDFKLYKAIQDGYGNALPSGRYPLTVLNIDMDPHLLDVNVHPSKWEVRLSKETQLEYLIRDGIHDALNQAVPVPESRPVVRTPYYHPQSFDAEDLRPVQTEETIETHNTEKSGEPVRSGIEQSHKEIKQEIQPEKQTEERSVQSAEPTEPTEVQQDNALLSHYSVREEKKYEPKKKVFPQMSLIGQYKEKWILCACEKGIAVVDQKRAMAVVKFQQVLDGLHKEPVMSSLLVPYTIHAGADLVLRLGVINDQVSCLHIHFEPFGNDTLMVREIPSWLQDMDPSAFLEDLVDAFRHDEKVDAMRILKQQMTKTVVSRNQNAVLGKEEMQALLDQLSGCEDPFVTTDGKPVFVIVDEKTLARGFR
ncbi:MAG: DNA mismatch repair endonuclease MutL [Lactimicrobium sp.]|uniref:DNA mismatch repair endonuclease MutL n=1 Tax=Lactimicrobium sp. TaxID=2563780 RepID=UPI002F352A44